MQTQGHFDPVPKQLKVDLPDYTGFCKLYERTTTTISEQLYRYDTIPVLTASDHTRSTQAPHVKPPPIASNTMRSPCFMRPSRTATSSASGTDAADVFA